MNPNREKPHLKIKGDEFIIYYSPDVFALGIGIVKSVKACNFSGVSIQTTAIIGQAHCLADSSES